MEGTKLTREEEEAAFVAEMNALDAQLNSEHNENKEKLPKIFAALMCSRLKEPFGQELYGRAEKIFNEYLLRNKDYSWTVIDLLQRCIHEQTREGKTDRAPAEAKALLDEVLNRLENHWASYLSGVSSISKGNAGHLDLTQQFFAKIYREVFQITPVVAES